MDSQDVTPSVETVVSLLTEHYLDPDVAAELTHRLRASLAEGRYPADEAALAEAVTRDLQSANGDQHLRLVHHAEALPEREHGDDAAELDAFTLWAEQTSCGMARIERMAGNVGYLDIQPVLFPAVIAGESITAAMSLLALTDALIIDVRRCRGGDPSAVAWLCSYLFGRDAVELTGLQERGRLTQGWTLPFVPGRRFGATKPVYVLTSSTTFSGAEHLSYDLRRLGRAAIVGERTKGGAHAREGFRIGPHLEATIPVARAVSPATGGNWEGTGVTPDIATPADHALDRAYRLALEGVSALPGPVAAEAREALAAAV